MKRPFHIEVEPASASERVLAPTPNFPSRCHREAGLQPSLLARSYEADVRIRDSRFLRGLSHIESSVKGFATSSTKASTNDALEIHVQLVFERRLLLSVFQKQGRKHLKTF